MSMGNLPDLDSHGKGQNGFPIGNQMPMGNLNQTQSLGNSIDMNKQIWNNDA